MGLIANLAICIAALGVSIGVIAFVRRAAPQLGLVQLPNARSSHTSPIPAGGGLGIVAGTVLAMALVAPGLASPLTGLAATGLVIAALGFIDDRRPLPAGLKLGVQALCVAGVLWLARADLALGAAPLLFVPMGFIAGLWWLNLFNFMDGIDGIAGQEAMVMLGGALLLAALSDAGALADPLWWSAAGLIAATAGFLVFNWPPARIFMGDAGSLFLGLMIFAFALLSIGKGWASLPQWLLLGALFIVDASVTLLRRLRGGHRPDAAHRQHAYQILSRRLSSRTVTTAALAINVIVLLPLAFAAGSSDTTGFILVGLTYVALGIAALMIGAGTDV